MLKSIGSGVEEMMRQQIQHDVQTCIDMFTAIKQDDALITQLLRAVDVTVAAFAAGNKLILAGNGGSAADAQHLATEFVVRLNVNRPALPALALVTDCTALTACGNDFGFNQIFSRQLEALSKPGDVFFAISTSGNSPNVVQALLRAKDRGLVTVGLTGPKRGRMAPVCDYLLEVPCINQARIQEAHILIGHTFCVLVQERCFPEMFVAKASSK